MINNETVSISVLTYSGYDDYGQPRTDTPTVRTSNMMVKQYQHRETDDVRFNDVEYIGLTKDKDITDENRILYNNHYYNVIYVIPSRRFNQVFLKLWK